ncbi:hypothetical protein ACP4OV_026142 [Aristida adscensionis]
MSPLGAAPSPLVTMVGAVVVGNLNGCLSFKDIWSLTELHLSQVCITGDGLGCLVSTLFALEVLELSYCYELICMKVTFLLERLTCLSLFECNMLEVIESKAPNFSTFDFFGEAVQLSFGEASQGKNLNVDFSYKPSTIS